MKRTSCIALLMVGCAHSAATPGPSVASNVAEYYPLAVGNSWSYEGTLLGGPAKVDVTLVKEEQGRFIDSNGNALMVDRYGVRDDKRYLLRGPLEVGTRWNNVVSISSYEQYAIVEAGQACQAPAGRFTDCVVVESRNKDQGERLLVNTMTFAPKVGVIRIATALEDQGRRIPQVTLELTRYQVGPGASAPAQAPAPTR